MLNQAITKDNLLKLLRRHEPKKFKMGRERDDYATFIENTLKSINPLNHNFLSLKSAKVNGKNIIIISDIIETLILRKCDDNIKRIFNLKKTDRQDIIKKTHIMLSEPVPHFVYRLDISSFYEHVDKHKILEKINNNSIVSYSTKKIVTNFFHQNNLPASKGLPRGIGLSSTLAELYLEDFDSELNKNGTIYYHCRYVDDIIIFTFERIPDYIDYFQNLLPKPLQLNPEKCDEFVIDGEKEKNHNLDFLGYRFVASNKCIDKSRKVAIEVSHKKINKIKKRIILALKDFCRNGNSSLLDKRIKYLTGNIPVHKKQDDNSKLYSGTYYTFLHLTECEQLKELDIFKNGLIHSSNGELARKLKLHPTNSYQNIKKYSFYYGHKNKIKYNFTPSEIKEITRIW